MFVSGEKYSRLVHEMFSASDSMDIAVAFLGSGAEQLISKAVSGRVICNLESGATNPAVVRVLRENSSFEIKSMSNLHAKVILSGDSVLCGSANISANGLGLESAEIAYWNEAGIFSKDVSVVAASQAWFSDVWQKAIVIGDEDLKVAEARWAARRNTRPSGANPSTGLFLHILTNPNFALDRPIYLAVYRESASVEASNAFKRWKENEAMGDDAKLDFYENWSELPDNAYLIDIYCGPRGGVSSQGLYWTGAEKITKKFNYRGAGSGEVRIVFKQKTYDGLPVIRSELKNFVELVAPIVRQWCEKREVVGEDISICEPLVSILDTVGHTMKIK